MKTEILRGGALQGMETSMARSIETMDGEIDEDLHREELDGAMEGDLHGAVDGELVGVLHGEELKGAMDGELTGDDLDREGKRQGVW
jgi:hypothetical protein